MSVPDILTSKIRAVAFVAKAFSTKAEPGRFYKVSEIISKLIPSTNTRSATSQVYCELDNLSAAFGDANLRKAVKKCIPGEQIDFNRFNGSYELSFSKTYVSKEKLVDLVDFKV